MSVILQPQSSFPIVRQIANHLDTDTYYVRAVVRNADGDAIATVDLEDKGGQRFQRRWRVPVDASGQGSYISIITSVYTDVGYTTKSPNYGDEENTYLVFDRVRGTGGGGGGGLDTATLRRIVSEELAKLPQPEPLEIPEPPRYEMRWQDVLASIDEVRDMVARIPTEKVMIDLQPVLARIDATLAAIEQKPVTPETDVMPVVTELASLADTMTTELQAHRQAVVDMRDLLLRELTETINDNMQNTEFAASEIVITPKKREKQRNEPVPIDLRQLV